VARFTRGPIRTVHIYFILLRTSKKLEWPSGLSSRHGRVVKAIALKKKRAIVISRAGSNPADDESLFAFQSLKVESLFILKSRIDQFMIEGGVWPDFAN
jgi:hypothetical protein